MRRVGGVQRLLAALAKASCPEIVRKTLLLLVTLLRRNPKNMR